MDRIKVDRGFLHLVVSNEDDDKYYTSDFLCLNYQKYMFSELLNKGFSCIYFLDGDRENCTVTTTNEYSSFVFQKVKENALKKFFDIVKKSDYNTKRAEFSQKYMTAEYTMSNSEMLKSIISIMKNNKTAVVISPSFFYELSRARKIMEELREMENNSQKSILLISISANADCSIKYFFLEYDDREKIFDIENGVLAASIFDNKLKSTISSNTGYCFLFDVLNINFRERLVFLK